MTEGFDWRKYQFITEVQTAVICNAIRKKNSDEFQGNDEFFSATGASCIMEEAFLAAENLPSDQSPHESAVQFIGFHVAKSEHSGVMWFQRG